MNYKFTTDDLLQIRNLSAGDSFELSGILYTARDAAHMRLFELLDKNEPLPFQIENAFIYYAGPTPAKPGKIIGSCGPTTSARMDEFTPRLMDIGLFATIGKGERSDAVADSCRKNNGVYLCAVGGAGALAARSVVACETVAFEDLGCESIKRLEVKDFPLTVAIDASGKSIFEKWKISTKQ